MQVEQQIDAVLEGVWAAALDAQAMMAEPDATEEHYLRKKGHHIGQARARILELLTPAAELGRQAMLAYMFPSVVVVCLGVGIAVGHVGGGLTPWVVLVAAVGLSVASVVVIVRARRDLKDARDQQVEERQTTTRP